MSVMPFTFFLISLFLYTQHALALSQPSSYHDVFIDPDYVLKGNFSNITSLAQESIQAWATELAQKGPWTVTNKTILPPSGDVHDYMSWAPYSWPNCTGVGNTTVLNDTEIYAQCPYHLIDGVFNPDCRLIDNIGAFSDLADAVLYNTLAWAVTNKSHAYVANAVNFIDTWFLKNETRMNPNLEYAQMRRGPEGQIGAHTGILDLKGMTKILTGILILRKGNSTLWTPDLDSAMVDWTNQYISWLQTAPSAILESQAPNNHGSFYFTQMTSLQILVGDLEGALNTTQFYFNTTYMKQINAGGEQPFEAARTRPYHYRTYNLAAMITSAKLGSYLGWTGGWNTPTDANATIADALNYTIHTTPRANETEALPEVFPAVGAVAAHFGDPGHLLADWMYAKFKSYSHSPWFLWSQPMSDHGYLAELSSPNKTLPSVAPAPSYTSSDAVGSFESRVGLVGLLLISSVFLLL